MRHIRYRSQIIQYIEEKGPRQCIRDCASNGKVELIGGFTSFWPFEDKGGWAFIARSSRTKQYWIVLVYADKKWSNRFKVIDNVDDIPWAYWNGDVQKDFLHAGDYPEKYKEEKDKVTEHQNNWLNNLSI